LGTSVLGTCAHCNLTYIIFKSHFMKMFIIRGQITTDLNYRITWRSSPFRYVFYFYIEILKFRQKRGIESHTSMFDGIGEQQIQIYNFSNFNCTSENFTTSTFICHYQTCIVL